MPAILSTMVEGVRVLTLHRPEKFNSFNREMALLLQQELDLAAADPQVRSVLITGEGKAFCAGQDLSEAIDPAGPGIQAIVREQYNPLVEKIRAMEKPVIAAVNGVAAGAGANLAFACDLVISAESASFIQAFSKIGLVPDTGGTFFLPRMIGFQRAMALMMLGDKISAADALSLGMLYKVVPDANLREDAMKVALQLAAMPTRALAFTKLLLNQSMSNTLQQQLVAEEKYQAAAGETDDYREGVKAFLEKRKPEFKGK